MSQTLKAHLERQRTFSETTFGPQAPAGVIAHIRKELWEIEKDPADIVEWVDVMLLALDGTWRSQHPIESTLEHLSKTRALEKERGPDPGLLAVFQRARLPEDGDAFNALALLQAHVFALERAPDSLEAWVNVFAAAASGGLLAAGNSTQLHNVFLSKFERNLARSWPNWREVSLDQAIEHDRALD